MTELRAPRPDFDRTTALMANPDRPGEFAVELDDGWSALVGVHGGYMTALAVRGAEALAPDRTVRTVTTGFLRSGHPGPATLSLHEVRRGRTMTTMTAELCQDDRLLLTSRLTLQTDRTGVEWAAPVDLDLPPVEECEPIPHERGRHFERAHGRLDPSSIPFTGGDRAMVRGYLRPLDSVHVDAAWLAMASDWFPPPAFVRIDPPTGGVSIDLTTHIHRPSLLLGDDEWLTGAFEIETSVSGLAVEHGVIATVDGDLVAESFQTRLTAHD